MLDLSEILSNTLTKNLGSSQAVTAILPWCTQGTDNLETQLAKHVKINHNISGFPHFPFLKKPTKTRYEFIVTKKFSWHKHCKGRLVEDICWAGSTRSWVQSPTLTPTQKQALLPHPSSTFPAANRGMPLSMVSLNVSLWMAAWCMHVGWRCSGCPLILERETFFPFSVCFVNQLLNYVLLHSHFFCPYLT